MARGRMGQQRNHTIGAIGAGHGLQHLRGHRLQRLRPEQHGVLLLPTGCGNQALQRQLQTPALLKQMRAFEQKQPLLTATTRLLQGPNLLNQGLRRLLIRSAGDRQIAQSGAGECRSSSRCLQTEVKPFTDATEPSMPSVRRFSTNFLITSSPWPHRGCRELTAQGSDPPWRPRRLRHY